MPTGLSFCLVVVARLTEFGPMLFRGSGSVNSFCSLWLWALQIELLHVFSSLSAVSYLPGLTAQRQFGLLVRGNDGKRWTYEDNFL